MKFHADVEGQRLELVLERAREDWVLNGRPVSVLEVEPGIYSILLEGRSYEARIERTVEGLAVHVGGCRFLVNVADPRRPDRKRRSSGREGPQQLVSPMPGKVVRLLAAAGQTVEAGQGILVIEAMKMQNEIKSPKAGRVSKLPVTEGAAVAAGDTVAVIE